ncbi:tRNA lysidine(34) synthetase TilS [Oryzisolibacter sp. LB2S]|uniref:tRNA lysidine(34) synthetase TilS n=1 Tax=Alicycliphilus soli TaxID=3228789 RepID=UPI00345A333B
MTQSLAAAMQAFTPRLPLAVALSGGADSTALLLASARRWPGQVHALHVHHGLQAAADDFERHCAALCARLQVPLTVRRVDARHAPGQSPEDAARQARYKAFEAMALDSQAQSAIQTIALAQHADDQVETLLLALSRGAGVAGLAAMPAQWQRGGLHWCRPLLGVAGADVRAWLRAQGEPWVEDPTNSDERYTRNRIRHRLLPALQQAFPQFRDTFARSCAHAAQADELLQELAVADLAATGRPPRIAALRLLSRARQANVLRHWLRSDHGTTPSAAQLDALLRQIAACTTRGHRIHLKVGRGHVVREGEALHWYNQQVLDFISARDGGAPKQSSQ